MLQQRSVVHQRICWQRKESGITGNGGALREEGPCVCPTGTNVYGFRSQIPEFPGADLIGVDTIQGVLKYKRPGQDSQVSWAPPSALRRIDVLLCDEASQFETPRGSASSPVSKSNRICRIVLSVPTFSSFSLWALEASASSFASVCRRWSLTPCIEPATRSICCSKAVFARSSRPGSCCWSISRIGIGSASLWSCALRGAWRCLGKRSVCSLGSQQQTQALRRSAGRRCGTRVSPRLTLPAALSVIPRRVEVAYFGAARCHSSSESTWTNSAALSTAHWPRSWNHCTATRSSLRGSSYRATTC